jgi:hypothetical protein
MIATLDHGSRDQFPGRKAFRRRAVEACMSSRHRKVRCDVTVRGLPCTNSRLDEKSCIVKERESRRCVYLRLTPCLHSKVLAANYAIVRFPGMTLR